MDYDTIPLRFINNRYSNTFNFSQTSQGATLQRGRRLGGRYDRECKPERANVYALVLCGSRQKMRSSERHRLKRPTIGGRGSLKPISIYLHR